MGVFFCSTATTKTSMRFIGISGSLRKASTNTGALRYASEAFSKAGHEFSIVNIGHLPFMNEDLEVGGLPEDVLNFKKEVESADGVLFGCPEYNYGVTPAMKNALDWASRSGNSWLVNLLVLLVRGGFGTGRSQLVLRQSFIYLDIHPLNKPEVCIRRFVQPSPFDADGNLVDDGIKAQVDALVSALIDWTKKISPSL